MLVWGVSVSVGGCGGECAGGVSMQVGVLVRVEVDVGCWYGWGVSVGVG